MIVFMKETLHHLARPYLGLYEMLRVAREGVVLIEPHYNHLALHRIGVKWLVRHLLRRLIGRYRVPDFHVMPAEEYEASGNFVFRLNPYELAQIARSAGVPTLVLGYSHFFYQTGCEKITGTALRELIAQKQCDFHRSDEKYGIDSRPLLIALLWKTPLSSDFDRALKENGFKIFSLSNSNNV